MDIVGVVLISFVMGFFAPFILLLYVIWNGKV